MSDPYQPSFRRLGRSYCPASKPCREAIDEVIAGLLEGRRPTQEEVLRVVDLTLLDLLCCSRPSARVGAARLLCSLHEKPAGTPEDGGLARVLGLAPAGLSIAP